MEVLSEAFGLNCCLFRLACLSFILGVRIRSSFQLMELKTLTSILVLSRLSVFVAESVFFLLTRFIFPSVGLAV